MLVVVEGRRPWSFGALGHMAKVCPVKRTRPPPCQTTTTTAAVVTAPVEEGVIIKPHLPRWGLEGCQKES